jgi:hypothetical protein
VIYLNTTRYLNYFKICHLIELIPTVLPPHIIDIGKRTVEIPFDAGD